MLDRMGLIIEIFNAHAFTKEAKLQVPIHLYAYFIFLYGQEYLYAYFNL